jgi:hypothetical protein
VRERGPTIAELLGGKKNRNPGSIIAKIAALVGAGSIPALRRLDRPATLNIALLNPQLDTRQQLSSGVAL